MNGDGARIRRAIGVGVFVLCGAALLSGRAVYRRHVYDGSIVAAEEQLQRGNLTAAVELAVGILTRFPGDERATTVLERVDRLHAARREEAEATQRQMWRTQTMRIDELEGNMDRSIARLSRAMAILADTTGRLESSQRDQVARVASARAILDEVYEEMTIAQVRLQDIESRGFVERLPDLSDAEEDEVLRLVDRGRTLYEAGTYIDARDEFERAVVIDAERSIAQAYLAATLFDHSPTDSEVRASATTLAIEATSDEEAAPFAYYTLGRIYEQEGLTEQAAGAYASAVSLDPGDMAANRALGVLLLRTGETAGARMYLERVLAARPYDDETRFHMMQLAVAEAEWSEVVVHGRLLEEAGSTAPAVYGHLGRAYRERGEWQAAVAAWERAYELRPGWEYRRDIAAVYAQRGDVASAMEHYLAAAAENPRNTAAMREEAYRLVSSASQFAEEHGRLSDAVEALEVGRELLPADARILFDLGSVHEREGRLRRAAEHYEGLVEMMPDFPGAYVALGRVYLAMDEQARARAVLRRLRRDRPDSADIAELEALVAR